MNKPKIIIIIQVHNTLWSRNTFIATPSVEKPQEASQSHNLIYIFLTQLNPSNKPIKKILNNPRAAKPFSFNGLNLQLYFSIPNEHKRSPAGSDQWFQKSPQVSKWPLSRCVLPFILQRKSQEPLTEKLSINLSIFSQLEQTTHLVNCALKSNYGQHNRPSRLSFYKSLLLTMLGVADRDWNSKLLEHQISSQQNFLKNNFACTDFNSIIRW